jgi:hypothetical protein
VRPEVPAPDSFVLNAMKTCFGEGLTLASLRGITFAIK